MNWKDKRFVPFDDETMWKYYQTGYGVYDQVANIRVISFTYKQNIDYSDGTKDLRSQIAEILNDFWEQNMIDTTVPYEIAKDLMESIIKHHQTKAPQ